MLCVRHCEGSDVAIKVFVHFISSNHYSHTIRMICNLGYFAGKKHEVQETKVISIRSELISGNVFNSACLTSTLMF